jgi:hypothetical protein
LPTPLRPRQAADHETGGVAAFWFGTREHKNLDRLLDPLNIGKVYADGSYAYYERFSPEVLTVTGSVSAPAIFYNRQLFFLAPCILPDSRTLLS